MNIDLDSVFATPGTVTIDCKVVSVRSPRAKPSLTYVYINVKLIVPDVAFDTQYMSSSVSKEVSTPSSTDNNINELSIILLSYLFLVYGIVILVDTCIS